jgi:hypothetical protein
MRDTSNLCWQDDDAAIVTAALRGPTCEGGDSHGGEEDLPEGRALEELEGDHEGGSDPGDEEEVP